MVSSSVRTRDAGDEFERPEHAAGAQDLEAAHLTLLALPAARHAARRLLLLQQRDQPASAQHSTAPVGHSIRFEWHWSCVSVS